MDIYLTRTKKQSLFNLTLRDTYTTFVLTKYSSKTFMKYTSQSYTRKLKYPVKPSNYLNTSSLGKFRTPLLHEILKFCNNIIVLYYLTLLNYSLSINLRRVENHFCKSCWLGSTSHWTQKWIWLVHSGWSLVVKFELYSPDFLLNHKVGWVY